MKKLHIIVVEPINGGGLLHFSYQLCNALSKNGAEIELITGTGYELDALPHHFKAQKILKLWNAFEDRSVDIKLNFFQKQMANLFRKIRRLPRAFRAIWAWVTLTRYILRAKPDWVLFSVLEYRFQSFFAGYLKMRGISLSQMCHEFEEREKSTFEITILKQLSVLWYSSFSRIFLLSEDARSRFLNAFHFVDAHKVISIPHGNSEWLLAIQSQSKKDVLREKYGIKEKEAVVVFFGLLSPSKGIEDLIEGFALALKSCNAKLVIAGYPTKYINASTLKDLVTRLNILDKVILDLQYVPLDEIGALMDLATVVVYPYLSSTQSGALQTAYTFGKPVIATKVGGLPEVVEDGKSGFLIAPRAPQEIAEKISFMVNNPIEAKKMGEYAKDLSETRFDWKVVAQKMLDAYQQS
ncbi:MAG: glycosyltransferase family 4 protein [Anaerolineales bacterium]|nr:glycosyltransferase family 4 protein [Anaerolineales bacterium]